MDTLLAARIQMGFALGFHMILASLGVGMPLLMVIAEGLWLRTRQRHYLDLARTWAKVTGVTFAIGAVSGTVLSFELGLLWPNFMGFAAAAVGPAFAAEGFAFFLEAIFIGLYLYGWNRLSPVAHWLTGIPVAISGAASSVLVVAANAWMQNPLGADLLRSRPDAFDPAAALFGNPAWPLMALHSTLAAYAATVFMVAGVYAWGAISGRQGPVQRAALLIAMGVGIVVAVLMPITGDASAKWDAREQPVKLAAMESQFRTERGAPLRIGGWPDPETQQVRWVLEVPRGLSFLAFGDFEAEVMGLDQVPRHEWPNVPLTHMAFQVMVAAGTLMVGVAALWWVAVWRRRGRELSDRLLTLLLLAASPMGILALEAGWVVTEVGRQPWTVYGVMRTSEAVTPAGTVVGTLIGTVLVYLLLGGALVWFLLRVRHGEAAGGYGGEVAS